MFELEPTNFSADTLGLIETNFPNIEIGLADYWQSFFNRVNNPELTQKMESVKTQVSEFIFENNLASAVIETPDYQQIYQKEKELRGTCAVGASICIDGRLPIIPMFGRIVNVWEKMAGVIKANKSQIDGRPELVSDRLTESVIQRAKDGEPLLEIMVAHTSFSQAN